MVMVQCIMKYVNTVFCRNQKNNCITLLISAFLITNNNIILVRACTKRHYFSQVVYKELWFGYVTGIITAFVTTSSAPVNGLHEKFFCLTFSFFCFSFFF